MRLCSLFATVFLAAISNGMSAPPATVRANDVDALADLANFRCVGSPTLRESRNGSPQNCAKALIQFFPNSITVGQFHHGGPMDLFRLPRTYSVGDCRVTVDLNRLGVVDGSWQQIWTSANTLITACTYFRNPSDAGTAATGGYIHAGQGNGLAVILTKHTDTTGNYSSSAEE
ncbi:MAG: hypothetical protein LQ346_007856 [Caloplaca aetnensis]|nr:MAG: hypothetical protein LQ346_007856 [Caloplaca aetnensis]